MSCRRLQVRNVVDNEDGELVDPGGHPLPPCIVMERGESLDLWSDRNAPDRAQAFTVRLRRPLWSSSACYRMFGPLEQELQVA